MGRSRTLYTAMVLISVCVFGCLCAVHQAPKRGSGILEDWETSNSSFRVRITAYDEEGGYPSGAYYVFQSTLLDSNDWHEFLIFRHDDQVKIPHENVRFPSDSVGYVFLGWNYAVTTDGGRTWHVWDAQKDLDNWTCCNYGLIKDVHLTQSGSGVMILDPISRGEGGVSLLYTADFGQHWSSASGSLVR
jgi:hypothetical protein